MEENIQYVNKTGADIRAVFPIFQAAYKTGELDEDFQDIFKIEILKKYNTDGSDRMIIDFL